jgi:hypothetical protein
MIPNEKGSTPEYFFQVFLLIISKISFAVSPICNGDSVSKLKLKSF